MWIFYMAAGVVVAVILGGFVVINMNSSEIKKVQGALEQEKKNLEAMDFDALKTVLEEEPYTKITFDGSQLNREVTGGITDHGVSQTLNARVVVRGQRNNAIEETATITKKKEKQEKRKV